MKKGCSFIFYLVWNIQYGKTSHFFGLQVSKFKDKILSRDKKDDYEGI